MNLLGHTADWVTGRAKRYRLAGEILPVAAALHSQYLRTGDLDYLNKAIQYFQTAIAFTPEDHPDRLQQSFGLAGSLLRRYEASGDAPDLDVAVSAYERATQAALERPDATTIDGVPMAAAVVLNLGKALLERGKLTGDASDLDRAVDLNQQVFDGGPDQPATLIHSQVNLAAVLLARYRLTGRRADLDAGIAASHRALALLAEDSPERALVLSNLGALHRDRFWLAKDPADLDTAVERARDAVTCSEPSHPDMAARLANLRGTLRDRYDLAGRRADLDDAITAAEQALTASLSSRASEPNRFYLADTLLDRYAVTEDIADAESAASLLIEAFSGPVTHPPAARQAGTLGRALRFTALHRGDLDLLRDAIAISRQAVELTSEADADRAERCTELAITLQSGFELSGDLSMLAEAAELARQAAGLEPAGSAVRAIALSNLASFLTQLAEHSGESGHLDEAVTAARAAVGIEVSEQLSGQIRHNLAAALYATFLRQADLNLLREAVREQREAVAQTSAESLQLHDRLNTLLTLLLALLERTGEPELVGEAERAGRLALQAPSSGQAGNYLSQMERLSAALEAAAGSTIAHQVLADAAAAGEQILADLPPGHARRAFHLTNLGSILVRAFELTGEESAMRRAIAILREAVAETPVGHAYYASRLEDLALAWQRLAERTGELEAMEESVGLHRRATAARGASAADNSAYVLNLSRALRHLYQLTRDTDTLREAAELGRRAVAEGPETGREAMVALNHLGLTLSYLYPVVREPEILAELLTVTQTAEAAIEPDHPEHALASSNYGDALMMQFYWTNADSAVLAAAQRQYAQAAASPLAPVHVRILCHQIWAAIGPDNPQCTPDERLGALEEAVALLPRMAPRHLARADREQFIAKLSGLPASAAAAALQAGQPARAVELLEASRGIMSAGTLDARSSDIGQLRDADTDLADRFEALAARVEDLEERLTRTLGGPAADRSGWTATSDLIAERHRADDDFGALLGEIRADPRFAGFMRPPSAESIAAHADEGPIVYLTADSDRCDALIIRGDSASPITHLPLTAVSGEEAEERTREFLQALGASIDPAAGLAQLLSAEAEVREVLAWLWDAIAEPVLIELGLTGPPDPNVPWPRIWWCPVGRLAVLPVHAAGHHLSAPDGDQAHRSVLDRAISSYTTTVRALAYARLEAAGTRDGPTRMLVIAETGGSDGISHLPGADAEVALLSSRMPDADVLPHPDHDQVLAALPGHAIAHFACHGVADWSDPGSSKLILRDHESAALTVRDVSVLRLSDARLAYLSACETSITSADLADETVHITSAFQLAGYQNVIGALWPVHDPVAAKVSGEFYRHLTSDWTAPAETSRSALALHEAVRSARDDNRSSPIRWAPFVHFGG